MSKLMYELANVYVEEGRLSKRQKGEYEIFCYTKEEFFNKTDWDEVTKSHRGKIYRNGVSINNPFPKIFNLDEVEECSFNNVSSLIGIETPFDVYDKANGHLLIVSCLPNGEVILSTKGSIEPSEDNWLLQKDIELFDRKYKEGLAPRVYATLMFEVIAEYDKHTMYELEKKRLEEQGFEGDCLMLLGGYISPDSINWVPLKYEDLEDLSYELGCPLIQRRNDLKSLLVDCPNEIQKFFDHEDTEGYVLHFPTIDFRVKVKTKEYWALRLKKDLTTEKILGIFESGGRLGLMTKLPEEISNKVIYIVIKHYSQWYYERSAKLFERVSIHEAINLSDKEIFTNPNFSNDEKLYLKDIKYKRSYFQILDRVERTKDLRKIFVENFTSGKNFNIINEEIAGIVESL